MIEEGKFGTAEAVCLIVITISSKVFFSSPATLSRLVGSAMWYTTIISGLLALVGFYFICRLLKRFPNNDLPEIFEQSVGRWAGFAMSFIMVVFAITLSTIRMSETTEFLRVYVMPDTANWFLNGIFAVCVLTMSILGLESMARFSKAVMYSLVFGLVLVFVLNIQNYDLNNLFPILGYGAGNVVTYGAIRASAYGEVITLAIFAKSFQGVQYIKREGYISIAISILVISGCTLAYTLTYPYFTTQEVTAPIYEMTMLISYGRFIQRLEAFFLYVWIISSFVSTTVIFYSSVWMYCKIFRIEDRRQVIIAGVVIIYALSMMHGSIINIINDYTLIMRYMGSIPFYGFPIIALICAYFRKKGVGANA